MSAFDGLSPTQTRALAALATCRTLGGAAKRAKCGASTLRRWLTKDAKFQVAWREVRASLVEEAVSQAQRSATAAVLTLHQIMRQSDMDFARIAAARSILDVSLRAVERDALLSRLATVEAFLEETRREST